MRSRATIATAILAMVALGGVLATPAMLVRVRLEDGSTLVCRRVSPASTIAITFTHSLYGGHVTETYVPGGGALVRSSIVTANAAAAEYYAWDGAVRATDDGYEVVAPPLAVDALPIRVDQVGDHRLTVDETVFPLAAMVDGSVQVWLDLVSRPLISQMWGTRC